MMNKEFKIGGMVQIAEGRTAYLFITKGTHYMVRDIEGDVLRLKGDDGTSRWYRHERFEVVSPTTEESTVADSRDSWNFRINCIEQVNFTLILETLSYKEPLAFVTVDGDDGETLEFVVVHESIYTKAYYSKGMKQVKKALNSDDAIFHVNGFILAMESIKERKDWVTLVEGVRNAPYKKKYHKPSKVTVLKPKVK